MTVAQLPTELLIPILRASCATSSPSERVEQLQTCSLVSSSFRLIAQLELFHTPSVTSIRSLSLFSATLTSRPDLAAAVRSLAISCISRTEEGYWGLNEPFWIELLSKCVRIAELELKGVPFWLSSLRVLPELETLALSSIPLFPESQISDEPYSCSLRTLYLAGVTPPPAPFLIPDRLPSLVHLVARYITLLPLSSLSRSLLPIIPQLCSLALYIGDSALASQSPELSSPHKILYKIESDDLHLLQTSLEIPTWGIKNIWYFPYHAVERGPGLVAGELEAFVVTVRNGGQSFTTCERIYLAKEWETGSLATDSVVKRIMLELAEVCEEKGIKLLRDRSDGKLVCERFVEDMEVELKRRTDENE